jgi:hypothetical protein
VERGVGSRVAHRRLRCGHTHPEGRQSVAGLVGIGVQRDLAVVHRHDPISEGKRVPQVVGHEHDPGALGVALPEAGDHRLAGRRVQPGERFVQHEVARLHRQRTRDCDTLALAARQRIDTLRLSPCHPDRRQRVGDPAVDLLAGQSEVLRPERHVRADRRRDDLIAGVLKHHPDCGPGRDQIVGDRRAVHQHLARVRCQQAVAVPDERRLAGAVRPREDEELAVRNRERDRIEREAVAVPVGDVPEFDHRVGSTPARHRRLGSSRSTISPPRDGRFGRCRLRRRS